MSLQVSLGLRPLTDLRRQIARIRAGERKDLPVAVPTEVAPLVEELNALLDAQEREIVRSRGRAADLAHGFKTPLAALVADAARLRERGEAQLARNIEGVAEAMSRQVDRELARARLRGGVHRAAAVETELAPLVASLVATLARTPSAARIRFETAVPDRLRLPFDRGDLAEVLGNLLENAARHARSRVRVTVAPGPLGVVVEDDGAGIAEDRIARVLERGIRLDQRAPGRGLGLAIVQDVLDAYGWRLQIDRSDLGGARVAITSSRATPPPAVGQSGAPGQRHPS
jgi:signal transduction histidine kinase